MLKEFKAFMLKGNILELAIAFIMGAAFTAVVTSFTTGIVQPFIGAIIGKPQFDTVWHLGKGAIAIGAFLTAVINFVLIAAVAFGIVKLATAAMRNRKDEEVIDLPKSEEVLVLAEIRDLLASQR